MSPRAMCLPRRFLVMILLCLYTLAFFCQTYSPGAIQYDLMEELNLTATQYSGLYSVAAWSSLLDVINGFIIEKWLGLRLATYIYMVIILVGNLIYISSAFIRSYALMVLGRTVFGLGGNPMFLCINCFILHWFVGKEVNLMFSTLVSVIWLGSSLAYFVSVRIVSYIRTFPSVSPYMSLAITICSLTTLLTILMDVSSGLIIVQYKEKEKPLVLKVENGRKEEKQLQDKKSLRSLLNFHPIFWIFALSSFLYFISIVSFTSMSQDFFTTKYGTSVEESSDLSTLFTILAFLLSPPLGYLADRCGRNLIFSTLGLLLALTAHALFLFTMVNPVLPVVLMSVSGALSSFAWSMFAYIVEEHQFTMAYGIAQTGVNFSLALGSVLSGYIVDRYGYRYLELFYLILVSCSLPLLLVVWMLDMRMGHPLTMSAAERKQREESKKRLSLDTSSDGQTTPPARRALDLTSS